MQGLFNSFHKNLRFTVNRFENEVLHFLANKMSAQSLTDYHKNTSTEQYAHYDSFIPWSYKISWICGMLQEPKLFLV